MICNKHDLKEYIAADRNVRRKISPYSLKDIATLDHSFLLEKYQELLRKDEYYTNTAKGLKKVVLYFFRLRKNILGRKLGFTISPNVFDKGLLIWHYGNIVVNGYAKVGENCVLHGSNCIGNNGKNIGAPQIGKNVDIGVGAKIIGDVFIADNIIIGAGAIVVTSFYEEGITIAGVPARKIKKEIIDDN